MLKQRYLNKFVLDFTSCWLLQRIHRSTLQLKLQFTVHIIRVTSYVIGMFSEYGSDLIPQDFSMETEAMSVQRASVSRETTLLLHLREADCPGLRAQQAQLEVSWSQLTSDLSKIQERLQQVQYLTAGKTQRVSNIR